MARLLQRPAVQRSRTADKEEHNPDEIAVKDIAAFREREQRGSCRRRKRLREDNDHLRKTINGRERIR